MGGEEPSVPAVLVRVGRLGSMAGPDCRVLIVGCGISGVAAAQRLLESGFKQVRILEATARSGGRILTEALGERHGCPVAQRRLGGESGFRFEAAS